VIVLDTNVLSEPLRAAPSPSVMNWLAANTVATVTAISVGEVLSGVARMPDGTRKARLALAIDATIARADVLPYDAAAARVFGDIHNSRRLMGRPLSVEDGMIAAICISRNATLATRNVKDFVGLELQLVNPWEDDREG
jgi:predicted nucleic acid-binding protein